MLIAIIHPITMSVASPFQCKYSTRKKDCYPLEQTM